MTQVRNNPEKLRDFCNDLNTHANYWQNSVRALENYISRLAKSWIDDEFEEFTSEVTRLRISLDRFSEETRQVIAELIKDAEKLENSQKIKL